MMEPRCASDSKEQDSQESDTNGVLAGTSLVSPETLLNSNTRSTNEVGPQLTEPSQLERAMHQDIQDAEPRVMDTSEAKETTHQLVIDSSQLEEEPSSTHQVITKASQLGKELACDNSAYQLITEPPQLQEEPSSTNQAIEADGIHDNSVYRPITESSQLEKKEGDHSCCESTYQVITEVSQLEAERAGPQSITESLQPGNHEVLPQNKVAGVTDESSQQAKGLEPPPDITTYQVITEVSQLKGEGTEPSDSTHQVITESSDLQTEEVELSPSDSNDRQIFRSQLNARKQSTTNHFPYANQHCPWHYLVLWSLLVVVSASVWYTSTSVLDKEHVSELCRRVVSDDLANQRRELEEIIRNFEGELKDIVFQNKALEERARKIEEVLKGVVNQSTALEESMSDTEWHLQDLQRKLSANDFAIQNLRYDLNKDVKLRLTDLEVKSETDSQSLLGLDNKIQGLEANVEQLNVDITELKSGFTKYIDDTVKKALKYFFPQKLSGNSYQGR